MNILGIETSCDETAASVVQDGRTILSNVVISSLKEHARYGGIIPEIASRRQLDCILPVIKQSVDQAGLTLKKINALAVTTQPGLIGSLLVGTSFAQALSAALKKPLINVNHIHAHLYANFLDRKPAPKLPAVGLVVSGGHTSLFYVKDEHTYRSIGQTRDDAAGEAFDKVARILDLGYPGGPVIDRLAAKEKNSDIPFTCAPLKNTLDFSFSGIKTAVLYYHNAHKNKADFSVSKVVHSFQRSVVDVLAQKSLTACRQYKVKTLLVGGGVAANSALRAKLQEETKTANIQLHIPPMNLCLDNAAMIAGLGYHLYKSKERCVF